MKKLIIFLVANVFAISVAFSQGAAINSTGASADPSAMLDVSGTTSGVLINRMTETQRNAIVNPAFGLQIFNTSTGCFNFYTGSTWKQWCGDCDFAPPLPGNNSPFCEGSTLNLTATSIPGATYQWTGPNGFSSTDQNPSIPSATAAASGSYSVSATQNGCTSQPQTTIVTVNATPAAPPATNNGPLCAGQNLTLMTNVVSGAIYSWTGPNNFTANMQNPTLSNVNSVNAGTYNLTLSVNGCISTVGSTTLLLYNGSPLQPGAISGPTVNLGNQTNVTYSISPVNLATIYTWTVPVGVTIIGGQGGTSLTVEYTCSGDGDITVTANNACGISPPQTLYVSTDIPDPGAIAGNTIVCPNATETYSISPIPYVTNYTWTIPAGFTLISGQGTTSISVNVGTDSGDITVTQTSPCGTSNPITFTIYNALSTFTYSPPTGIIGGEPVTFIPSSTFSGATYSWTFPSGTPSSSTDQNPVVTWSVQTSPTSFDIVLIVNGCSPSTTNSVLVSKGQFFSYTGSITTFTVPSGISSITVEAYGARGGTSGGKGGYVKGTFSVSGGQQYKVLVGGKGGDGNGGGGGGGTYFTNSSNTPLLVAGGGGGLGYANTYTPSYMDGGACGASGCNASAGSCGTPGNGGSSGNGGVGGTCTQNGTGGGGGGGMTGNGSGANGCTYSSSTGGNSFTNGGAGGTCNCGQSGGFGGGGGGGCNGGGGSGGGGYSGGGGANPWCNSGGTGGNGAGGGSYNNGASQTNIAGGNNNNNGQLVISY